jgi:hypothetical protein
LTPIAVFSRFDNPSIFLLLLTAFISIRLVDLFVPFMVVPQELKIFLVLKTILDVEGQRQIIEHVLISGLVVLAHSAEKGFLVSKNVVVDEMILHAALADLRLFYCCEKRKMLQTAKKPLVVVFFT